MGSYTQYITKEGENLITRALGGDVLTFTEVVTSSDLAKGTEADIRLCTEIANVQQVTEPSSALKIGNNVIQVTATFENTGVERSYVVQTVGLFAKIGEETQKLFAIAQAQKPSEMPEANKTSYASLAFDFNITVQHAEKIEIMVAPGGSLPSEVFYSMFPGLNPPSYDDAGKMVQINENGKWEYKKPVTKTFIASGGDFVILELGINKESTLKELCEAMVAYRTDNHANHVQVDWWINTASKIGNEVRDKLNFTYGNLNLICQNHTVYLTLKKYYDAENPAKMYMCTYTKENNANSFSVWTTLEDMTKTVERLEKAIEDAEALRASPTVYGMTKITNSAAVTDSTGLALAATEKNATIGGTLANQLAQLNTDLQFREYINVLQPIDIPIHFSVIFSVGKIRQLIIKCGAAQSGGEFNLTQIPAAHRPAHPVYAVPIIGVPDGSGDSYLLRASINENGMITIANYSNNFAIESYIDIFYFSV